MYRTWIFALVLSLGLTLNAFPLHAQGRKAKPGSAKYVAELCRQNGPSDRAYCLGLVRGYLSGHYWGSWAATLFHFPITPGDENSVDRMDAARTAFGKSADDICTKDASIGTLVSVFVDFVEAEPFFHDIDAGQALGAMLSDRYPCARR